MGSNNIIRGNNNTSLGSNNHIVGNDNSITASDVFGQNINNVTVYSGSNINLFNVTDTIVAGTNITAIGVTSGGTLTGNNMTYVTNLVVVSSITYSDGVMVTGATNDFTPYGGIITPEISGDSGNSIIIGGNLNAISAGTVISSIISSSGSIIDAVALGQSSIVASNGVNIISGLTSGIFASATGTISGTSFSSMDATFGCTIFNGSNTSINSSNFCVISGGSSFYNFIAGTDSSMIDDSSNSNILGSSLSNISGCSYASIRDSGVCFIGSGSFLNIDSSQTCGISGSSSVVNWYNFINGSDTAYIRSSRQSSILNSENSLISGKTRAVIIACTGVTATTNNSVYVPNICVTKGISIYSAGTEATAGSVQLIAGSATINTTKVTAASLILLTAQDNNSIGVLRVNNRNVGTDFTIVSSNGADNGLVAWMIVEPF